MMLLSLLRNRAPLRPTGMRAAVFSLALFSVGYAGAQTPAAAPPPKSSVSVDARLVVVPVVVRDKHDALIRDLQQTAFALTVDGKPQTVRYFDHDSDVPLTLGLLVDTSQSQRGVLDDERAASATFLNKMLVEGRDKVFIVQFAHNIDLLQAPTASRAELQGALKQLEPPKPSFDRDDSGNSNDDRRSRDRSQAGTALYDAVFLSADEVLSKETGRRALIVLTDGDDRGSKESLTQAIESAQRANTVVYAIYYKGQEHYDRGGYGRSGQGGGFPGGGGRRGGGGGGGGGYPGGGSGGGYPGARSTVDGKKILERMCDETGGHVFEVSKKETVEAIYAAIGEELRSQYRLGFTPAPDAAESGYHQIAVTLTGPQAKGKLSVQARDGYYGK